MNLYPLLFQPVLKDYLWGGRSLETLFKRDLPQGIIAESWEIAAHENGDTVIRNGPYAGRSLTDLHAELGLALIGRRSSWAQERQKFPLLIKLLDAHRRLSVQVHPDDEYALTHEHNELGKTEMWVILHAEPEAEIILGVAPGTSRAAFRQALETGELAPLIHRIPVETGDFVCVPSGSLHAIMGGLVIAEIQQNSPTTYRVFDWNRLGDDGRPRPLHVDKALDVINFEQVAPSLPEIRQIVEEDGVRRLALCRNRYFSVERVEMAAGAAFQGECDGRTLEIWGAVSGEVMVNGGGRTVTLSAVRFTLLPAAMGAFTVAANSQASVLLRVYVQ
jgi:mannose-6-phosphate isomerase